MGKNAKSTTKRDIARRRRRGYKKLNMENDNRLELEHAHRSKLMQTSSNKTEETASVTSDTDTAGAELKEVELTNKKARNCNDTQDESPSPNLEIERISQAAEQNSPSARTGMSKIEIMQMKKQRRKALNKAKLAPAQTKEHSLEPAKATENNSKDSNQTSPSEDAVAKQTKGTDDWQTLRLGVKYRDVQLGNGPIVQDSKMVHINYTLRAKHASGKVVDSGSNFRFRMGKGEVIKGWDIGLSGMRQGSIRQLLVPPEAGYGKKNITAGRGVTLFFEINLLVC
jgi:FKBP-type peptidyl-prolyl cis-trans isomerase